MQLSCPRTVAALLILACTLSAHAATLTIGQPAPVLTFTQIYGAEHGTKTDWPSLRGKVVVLEFWATWCAPCIAEIPHLNDLAKSLSASPIQFISVDDEDSATVEPFIAKKPMSGWVGLSKAVFDAYGVQERPTTVVVDTRGNIAAILRPDQLDKDQLVALSAGKSVVFPTNTLPPEIAEAQKKAMAAAVAAAKTPSAKSTVKPLFEISITPGDPDGITMMSSESDTNGGPSAYSMSNATLFMLVPWATAIPAKRITFHGDFRKPHYNVHLTAPNLDIKALSPALELAVASAAGLRITHSSAEEDVWVLQATPQAAARLTPTVSAHGSMCFVDPRSNQLNMVKTSLDDLAPALEQAIGAPVVNESGIKGEFDATFTLPKDNPEAAKAALEVNLGLTLVKARRTIARITVDPLPQTAPSDQAVTTASKPIRVANPIPGQPAQVIAVPRQ
jgi:uncharacterized protein (TIGR03435 family)